MIYSLQLQNYDNIIVYNTYVNKIRLFTKRTATNETSWRVHTHATTKQEYGTFLHSSITN